jgi:cell division protein FtsB
MVTRPRIRAFFSALILYAIAAALIGYFGAREVVEQQAAALAADLNEAKAERERWERRVGLLKSDGLDPDMLDEQARALLGYADPHDLVMLRKPR